MNSFRTAHSETTKYQRTHRRIIRLRISHLLMCNKSIRYKFQSYYRLHEWNRILLLILCTKSMFFGRQAWKRAHSDLGLPCQHNLDGKHLSENANQVDITQF